MKTTEQLADAAQAQWFWKSPMLLRIAATIVKFVAEANGPIFTDQVPLDFVPKDDRNLIGQAWKRLRVRGLLKETRDWRKSHKPESRGRIIWQYDINSMSACRSFLRRNGFALEEPQMDLFKEI